MARKWKPQPVGAVLTKLAGSGRGPAPTPRAFRTSTDAAVDYRRADGSTGRASYWALLGVSRVWAVDLERHEFVVLELKVTKTADGWPEVHRGKWDTATGVSFEVVQGVEG